LENGDLKTQGPSASGTEDSIYHGVFYYYVIAPLYTFSGGDPGVVMIGVIILDCLAIFPIIWMTKNFSGSDCLSIISGILYAVSFDAITMGSYLYNVIITILFMPWFYLYLWMVFWEKKYKYLPLLTLLLGLCIQGAIYSVYLMIPLAGLLIKEFMSKRLFKKKYIKVFLISLITFIITISTIIISQFKLYLAGITASGSTRITEYNKEKLVNFLTESSAVYLEKIQNILFPGFLWMSTVVLIISVMFLWFEKDERQKLKFLLVWLLSPLSLFFLTNRTNYHLLAGIDGAIILLAILGLNLWRNDLVRRVAMLCLVGFSLFTSISTVNRERKEKHSFLDVQSGAYLNEQLSLIDYSYEKASGKPFSIAVLGAPHDYSTTWAYLYDWYGKNKFGYKPKWFGGEQKGIPAGDLLDRTNKTLENHFAIFEPNPGTTKYFRDQFNELQYIYAKNLIEEKYFGAIAVYFRN
jgi:hypothetical protein